MRECYRKNKYTIYENIKNKHILMFTYLDEKEHKYVDIEDKMVKLMKKLIQISNNE